MSTAETQRPAKVYLGDSVYARIDNGTLVLTTENGLPRVPRNVIVLEPFVYAALVRFMEEHSGKEDWSI